MCPPTRPRWNHGKSAESLLILAVSGSELVDRMPLKGKPLDDAQIELLKNWIDQGAAAPNEPVPANRQIHAAR